MKLNLLLVAIICIFITSCSSKRNLSYFSDLPDSVAYKAKLLNIAETRIHTGDILSITVSSPSPESNVIFNNYVVNNTSGATDPTQIASTSTQTPMGYEVDKEGQISFPVLGKIELAGLTKEMATDKLNQALKQYIKNPIVNIRFLNFHITVIGEVNKPATFTIQNDRINVLEALGFAGDLTVYGKRENVLLIRQNGDSRTMVRLNLNNKSILESPYFYLQQNDVVYVEPDKSKIQLTNSSRATSFIVAGATVLGILISKLL